MVPQLVLHSADVVP